MRYWRGLFRLWIVMSALWVVGWTTAVFREWPTEGKTGYIYSARKDTGELVEFPPNDKRGARLKGRDDLIWVALPSGAYTIVRKDWPEEERDTRAAAIWQKLEQRKEKQSREKIASFIAMMTIPPMFFSLGLMAFWVRRGFGGRDQ